MRGRIAFISTLVVIALVLGSWMLIEAGQARVAATHSTAASLCAALPGEGLLKVAGTNWEILEDREYDRVVTELSKSFSIDSGRGRRKGILVDAWGNRLKIAVRNNSEGKREYKVFSAGADRVLNTGDDIVVSDHTNPDK